MAHVSGFDPHTLDGGAASLTPKRPGTEGMEPSATQTSQRQDERVGDSSTTSRVYTRDQFLKQILAHTYETFIHAKRAETCDDFETAMLDAHDKAQQVLAAIQSLIAIPQLEALQGARTGVNTIATGEVSQYSGTSSDNSGIPRAFATVTKPLVPSASISSLHSADPPTSIDDDQGDTGAGDIDTTLTDIAQSQDKARDVDTDTAKVELLEPARGHDQARVSPPHTPVHLPAPPPPPSALAPVSGDQAEVGGDGGHGSTTRVEDGPDSGK